MKAHLCCCSKYNDSIWSNSYAAFNPNSSCNNSDCAQEQGSAKASLICQGWVTGLHRNPCKSQIVDDTAWSGVRMLTCAPEWLTRCLVRADTMQGWRSTARLLNCLDSLSTLAWKLNDPGSHCLVDLQKSTFRHPLASSCAPYNLLGLVVPREEMPEDIPPPGPALLHHGQVGRKFCCWHVAEWSHWFLSSLPSRSWFALQWSMWKSLLYHANHRTTYLDMYEGFRQWGQFLPEPKSGCVQSGYSRVLCKEVKIYYIYIYYLYITHNI